MLLYYYNVSSSSMLHEAWCRKNFSDNGSAHTSIKSLTQIFWLETAWPSGLRRYVQVVVRKGVGSNPTAVIFGRCVCFSLIARANGETDSSAISCNATICIGCLV